MSQFRTKMQGRANLCWGAECGDEPFDQSLGWSDLDPDLYIFPHSHACVDDYRASLLQHCTEGLVANVCVQWNKAADPVTRQRIANLVTVMPISEALEQGATVRDDWFAASSRGFLSSWFTPKQTGAAVDDGEAIGILDAVVKTLRDADTLVFDPLALTRIAFHASFNPVALCPSAFALGELLTVAAWTGMLHRGRTVVMPRFVASYWRMLLAEADLNPPSWEPDAFLLHQAATIDGLEAIRKTSHLVSRTGPAKIRCRGPHPWATVKSIGLERPAADIRFQGRSDPLTTRPVSSSRL